LYRSRQSPCQLPIRSRSPEVKEAIAQDVKAQLAEEQAAAGPAPQAQSVSDEVPPHLIPRGVRLLYRRTWP
jgi:hypothetical protein